jgi:hypothetical protein
MRISHAWGGFLASCYIFTALFIGRIANPIVAESYRRAHESLPPSTAMLVELHWGVYLVTGLLIGLLLFAKGSYGSRRVSIAIDTVMSFVYVALILAYATTINVVHIPLCVPYK